MKEDKLIVISLGGSLIVPDNIDTNFLSSLKNLIEEQVTKGHKFVIVTGGGKTCRRYQKAASEVNPKLSEEDLDWIGIYTNHFNGHLLHYIFKNLSDKTFIGDPTTISMSERPVMIVGGGWKPGSSSDFDTVEAANAVGADTVINLSNINAVYSEDPKKNPNAEKLIYRCGNLKC